MRLGKSQVNTPPLARLRALFQRGTIVSTNLGYGKGKKKKEHPADVVTTDHRFLMCITVDFHIDTRCVYPLFDNHSFFISIPRWNLAEWGENLRNFAHFFIYFIHTYIYIRLGRIIRCKNGATSILKRCDRTIDRHVSLKRRAN